LLGSLRSTLANLGIHAHPYTSLPLPTTSFHTPPTTPAALVDVFLGNQDDGYASGEPQIRACCIGWPRVTSTPPRILQHSLPAFSFKLTQPISSIQCVLHRKHYTVSIFRPGLLDYFQKAAGILRWLHSPGPRDVRREYSRAANKHLDASLEVWR
jgi:hypothetical protein